MNVAGKIVVVTGGVSGIDRALAERCAASGASHVVVADIADDARQVVRSIGGTATSTDVGVGADVRELGELIEGEIGPIGLFCSNAGVLERDGGPCDAASALEAAWERSWKINVMAHKDDGIGVSDTPMVAGRAMVGADIDGVVSPAQVAACAIDAVEQGLFRILPHPEVQDYFTRKAADYERWIGGRAKLRLGLLRGSA